MQHKLKHIKTVRTSLADGRTVTYYYHRLTGKRIEGEPGTDGFLEAYNVAKRFDGPMPGTFAALVSDYKQDDAFKMLRERTRADYEKLFSRIVNEFGNAPVGAFEDRRMRKDIRKWRDKLAVRSLRQADYAVSVLSAVLKFGVDDGQLRYNIAGSIKRLYRSDRADKIWTPQQIDAMDAAANSALRAALHLAHDIGQREGDLIRVPLSQYEHGRLRLKQSKGGRWIDIPLTERARAALESDLERRSRLQTKVPAMTLLAGMRGRPWTEGGFGAEWQKAAKRAGVHKVVTFHDLRGTCVTRLWEAGNDLARICSITGHSLKSAEEIIDRYTARTKTLADSAIERLEAHRKR